MGISIVLWAALPLAAAAVAAVGYFFWYRGAINRQLAGGGCRREKLLPPARIAVLALIAALLIFAVGVAVMGRSRQPGLERRYWEAVYDFAVYTPQEMAQGYLSGYSADENPGYRKCLREDGGIRFTCFTYEGPFDYYHPAFLIYVELEAEEGAAMGFTGAFLTPEGEPITSRGASGGPAQPLWIIGTSSVDCVFSLTYYLYDEDQLDAQAASGELDAEQGAQARGSVQLALRHGEAAAENDP